MGVSFQELMGLILVVVLLSMAGIWPDVIRALRQLRGEHVEDEPDPKSSSAMPMKQDLDVCYKMMGLTPSAPWEAVEKAYRQKARIHHPDRGGDEDTMRALNEAYEQLKRTRRGRK